MSAQSDTYNNFLTLKQAAGILAVTIDTLLEWNDSNILKPTITQNGEIGYTPEQINKFLAIQQILSGKINNEEPKMSEQSPALPQKLGEAELANPVQLTPQKEDSPYQGLSENRYADEAILLSKTRNNKMRSVGLISSFTFIVIFLIVISVTQLNKSGPLLTRDMPAAQKETDNTQKVSALQINENRLSEADNSALQVRIKNGNTSDNNLNNTSLNDSENNLTASYLTFAKESATAGDIKHDQVPVIPVLGLTGITDITSGISTDAVSVNNSAIANFASRSNSAPGSKDTETVFDDDGNIKGETPTTDLLATTLGTTGIVWSDKPFKQAGNPNLLLALLTLGLLSVIFIFKNQPAYLAGKPDLSGVASHGFADDVQKQKILEINQKTDGTVVLYFQEKEYKISKPELNSESDQFIERLLVFAGTNSKEIDYDILKDEKLRLYAPLSKIVTRLGFVGLKRDLFFPRTSKNRVLFRRYVTQQDLASMGLTTDQISNELTN